MKLIWSPYYEPHNVALTKECIEKFPLMLGESLILAYE